MGRASPLRAGRDGPPRDPVTFTFEGHAVVGERGEPVAVALLAAGHRTIARSPKFHRPRGPWCLRAGCDGCLARVDEMPNVLTCRTPVEEGMRVEVQNVVGGADTDLLRAADWFFPEGMNHHELLAGVPGAQHVLGALARRMSGLGRLPTAERVRPVRSSTRRETDVLVVGAGPAGAAAAMELASRGRRVEVIDDSLHWGGGATALRALGQSEWGPFFRVFADQVEGGAIRLRTRTTAAGLFGDDVLVASETEGVEVVTARTLVLAPGAHDGALAFEGNDLPGVMSARAAGWLWARGVSLGARVVVVVAPDAGPFGELYARAVPGTTLVRGRPVRVDGAARARAVTVATERGDERLECDALVVDAPRSPAYEVCAQAGAELAHRDSGFVVVARAGKIRDGVFAVGEVVGAPLEFRALTSAAREVADHA